MLKHGILYRKLAPKPLRWLVVGKASHHGERPKAAAHHALLARQFSASFTNGDDDVHSCQHRPRLFKSMADDDKGEYLPSFARARILKSVAVLIGVIGGSGLYNLDNLTPV